ncbi:MAG TPA: tripartite tricarboxylate transporter substrate-binding protein [Burkholderiales bacterium]|nr:tripartite tricarboxylate transporter substrate-binding protein [Burkholderiales bacterium]
MTANAWHPEREIEIVAGTPPGGGLDRSARALAAAIADRKLLDVPVKVVNIPGDGARKAWGYIDRHAGDPHVLSISSPNLTTDHLVGIAAFDQNSYTPLAILYTEYIAFVVRRDSSIRNADDLVKRLRADPARVTVALSTALGNPNHIALAQVVRHAGGDPRAPAIRVFDSALDAVADVVAGHAHVGAVTAASAVRELGAGTLRTLAVSSPARLPGVFANAPTWREASVDCAIGAWRGVSGATGIDPPQIAFWQKICVAAVTSAAWRAELARHYWTEAYLDGAALLEYLEREREEMRAILGALALLR